MGLTVYCCHPKTISTLAIFFSWIEETSLGEGSRCCVRKEVIKLEMPLGGECQAHHSSARTGGHCLLLSPLGDWAGGEIVSGWSSHVEEGSSTGVKLLRWSPGSLVPFSSRCHPLGFAGCSCVLHFCILRVFCCLGNFRLYSSCCFLWGSVDVPLVVVQPPAHDMHSTFYLVGRQVSSVQGVLLPSLAFGTGWFWGKSLYCKEASSDREKISIK